MPVGGIKEKCMAAHRNGIKNVILPKKNENDYIEIGGIEENVSINWRKPVVCIWKGPPTCLLIGKSLVVWSGSGFSAGLLLEKL